MSSLYHELRRLEEELGEMVSQLAVVADLVAHGPPLAATFPDGREADGVLSPKQLAYIGSLAPAAERTVRYLELLAATSELPKQEQYVLDHRAIEESLARAMQSTCPRCGSGPGESCRTLGGRTLGARRRCILCGGRSCLPEHPFGLGVAGHDVVVTGVG